MDRRPDGGFTLVEAMAAGVVLSVVALCLVRSWATLDRLSFDMLLRQKAVLVLNGETERLTSLYATTGLGAATGFASGTPTTSGYTALPGYAASAAREAYATNTPGLLDVSSNVGTFSGADAGVLVTGSGAARRSYVWLDHGRNLVAQLSWLECGIGSTALADCWHGTAQGRPPPPPPPDNNPYQCWSFNGSGSSQCRLVTVVLDYPYALSSSGAVTAVGSKTLTVSTIVGRRQ